MICNMKKQAVIKCEVSTTHPVPYVCVDAYGYCDKVLYFKRLLNLYASQDFEKEVLNTYSWYTEHLETCLK